jgi:hypothetical protein
MKCSRRGGSAAGAAQLRQMRDEGLLGLGAVQAAQVESDPSVFDAADHRNGQAGHWANTSVSNVSRSGEVTSKRASQSRRTCPTCSGLSNGFKGTKTPPATGAPRLATTVSTRLSKQMVRHWCRGTQVRR